MQCAHNVIDVVFQFCCIFHGVSFTIATAQLYQKSLEAICRRQIKRGRVSPRTSLKVVFTSCSGCFQSQNAWVRNADAPLSNHLQNPTCPRARFRVKWLDSFTIEEFTNPKKRKQMKLKASRRGFLKSAASIAALTAGGCCNT
jgi:hypothetical protein